MDLRRRNIPLIINWMTMIIFFDCFLNFLGVWGQWRQWKLSPEYILPRNHCQIIEDLPIEKAKLGDMFASGIDRLRSRLVINGPYFKSLLEVFSIHVLLKKKCGNIIDPFNCICRKQRKGLWMIDEQIWLYFPFRNKTLRNRPSRLMWFHTRVFLWNGADIFPRIPWSLPST